MDPSSASSPSGTTTAIAAIAGGVAGGAALLAGALIFCLLRKRKRREDQKRADGGGGGGGRSAGGRGDKDNRPLSTPGKVFLSLGGGDGGAASDAEDEENASYSWTRENSDMNFHDSTKMVNANGGGSLAEVKEGFATGGGGGGAAAALRSSAAASSLSRSPPTAPSARLLTTDAASRLRPPASFPPLDDKIDPVNRAPTAAAGTASSTGAGSTAAGRVGPLTSGTVVEGVGDVVTAALAAAEALAQDSFIPGVSRQRCRQRRHTHIRSTYTQGTACLVSESVAPPPLYLSVLV